MLVAHGGQRLGGAFGVGQSAAAAARAAGPLVAGAVFDIRAALPYLVGTALCLAAIALLNATREDTHAAQHADGASDSSAALVYHGRVVTALVGGYG